MNMFLSVLSISCILLSAKSIKSPLSSTKPALNLNGWMGQLEDKLISNINIPGTHDTMAMNMGSLSDCNAYTISEQLSFGYRMFDLRVVVDHEKNGLWFYHGYGRTPFGWDYFHNAAKQFLKDNPTECVIAIVKNERANFFANAYGPKNKEFAQNFSRTISNYVNKPEDNIYYFGKGPNTPIPKISECKGKVVILADGEDNQKEWRDAAAWKALNPIQYKDIYIGEKLYNEKQTRYIASWYDMEPGKRRRWFHTDLLKAMNRRGGAAKKFWRIAGNTHSAKKMDPACGKPYAWAKWLNPYIYREVLAYSFHPTASKPKPFVPFSKCIKRFYGAILIDIPKKNNPNLYNEEIPKAIISSNCDLWNKVNHAALIEEFKNDYNKLPSNFVDKPSGWTGCHLAHTEYDNIGFYQDDDENNIEEDDDNDMEEDDIDIDTEKDDDQYVYPLYPMNDINLYNPNPSNNGLIEFGIFGVCILLFCMISCIAGGITGSIVAHFIHNNKSVDKNDDTEYENV